MLFTSLGYQLFINVEAPGFAEAAESHLRIPIDKISSQDEEILFYDRLYLFKDDLSGRGVCYLACKIRIMESYFLILQRYYCRRDGRDVCLYDTRFYHEFGTSFIIRDFEQVSS